jgi:hypothetical protein
MVFLCVPCSLVSHRVAAVELDPAADANLVGAGCKTLRLSLAHQGGNILVTEDGVIKLADFNSSKHLGDIAGAGSNPLKSLAGTPQFMAPVRR